MRKARQSIELSVILAKALQWVITDRETARKEGRDFRGDTYYFTASDVEQRVRAHSQELVDGLKEGELGRGYCCLGVRISTGAGMDLLHVVREFLFRKVRCGELAYADRKGTCSGARFRPVGWPLSPAEVRIKALSPEEKRRQAYIVHLETATSKQACPTAKRSPYSYRSSRHSIHSTVFPEKVSCRKCQALMAQGKATPAIVVGTQAFCKESWDSKVYLPVIVTAIVPGEYGPKFRIADLSTGLKVDMLETVDRHDLRTWQEKEAELKEEAEEAFDRADDEAFDREAAAKEVR